MDPGIDEKWANAATAPRALGDAIVSTGSATLQRAQSLVMYPTEKALQTSQRAASQRSSQASLHALDEAVEQQRQQEKGLLSQEEEELACGRIPIAVRAKKRRTSTGHCKRRHRGSQ